MLQGYQMAHPSSDSGCWVRQWRTLMSAQSSRQRHHRRGLACDSGGAEAVGIPAERERKPTSCSSKPLKRRGVWSALWVLRIWEWRGGRLSLYFRMWKKEKRREEEKEPGCGRYEGLLQGEQGKAVSIVERWGEKKNRSGGVRVTGREEDERKEEEERSEEQLGKR